MMMTGGNRRGEPGFGDQPSRQRSLYDGESAEHHRRKCLDVSPLADSRQNRSRRGTTIALWRDAVYGEREIALKPDHDACVLSLVARQDRRRQEGDGDEPGPLCGSAVRARPSGEAGTGAHAGTCSRRPQAGRHRYLPATRGAVAACAAPRDETTRLEPQAQGRQAYDPEARGPLTSHFNLHRDSPSLAWRTTRLVQSHQPE
jgi:hypothetical protein